jgi:hypothetical protein
MRAIFINESTNWSTLGNTLLPASGDHAQLLVKLQQLNPHVDFQHIASGAVILVPDEPALHPAASTSVSGDSFTALAAQFNLAVSATAADVRAGYDDLLAQQKDTLGLLKSAAVRRIVDGDPDLAKLAEAAVNAAQDDAAQAKNAEAAMATLQGLAGDELAALAGMLGATASATRASSRAGATAVSLGARRKR